MLAGKDEASSATYILFITTAGAEDRSSAHDDWRDRLGRERADEVVETVVSEDG